MNGKHLGSGKWGFCWWVWRIEAIKGCKEKNGMSDLTKVGVLLIPHQIVRRPPFVLFSLFVFSESHSYWTRRLLCCPCRFACSKHLVSIGSGANVRVTGFPFLLRHWYILQVQWRIVPWPFLSSWGFFTLTHYYYGELICWRVQISC